MMDLLKALIIVSEKAANIARACRQNEHLFSLLIQKKKNDEANPRFVDDFKTLADVLIQEMVKHDIKNQFQELSDILGEENNTFENKLGEKICVEIKNTEEETSNLLETVLNGDHIAATLLAAEVHKEIHIEDIKTNLTEKFHIVLEKLGIWIDPIDCTAEYINGSEGEKIENIYRNGLKCVTILIGVFDKETGCPVMGVINRPFLGTSDFGPTLPYIWGISSQNTYINSGISCSEEKSIICVSCSERTEIKQKLEEKGFKLIEACGAGYKILTVILGLADAYVLTKGTTFKWDTCAPHAILNSLGGGMTDFHETLRNNELSIKYFNGGNNCNVTGIIAFRRREVLKDIIDTLKDFY
ncbi:inositol polyphosphate 1-phosphatase [Anoplophora glabripennis]|uniref:inositol polyphosphate 1-phosphatase n=1 Tax=Anoplophora glabripennis TaxID=217634 RepID=UPI000875A182|nr:inositol polyphosphate 1-phosphatase [Anoplophora glabripennis]